jgi:hypothetical protein
MRKCFHLDTAGAACNARRQSMSTKRLHAVRRRAVLCGTICRFFARKTGEQNEPGNITRRKHLMSCTP